MPKERITGGYILLSRRLIESEIWDKPPMYLKVWIYILTKARHKATDRYSRGEMLISIPELQEACSHRVGYRVEKPKKHEIDNILRWLRRAGEGQHGYDSEEHTNTPMITTTKTTRGMVVKVHNYNVYQDPKNYEYDSAYDNGNDNATTANTTMLRQGSDTIHKNVKNVEEGKNVKNEKKRDSAGYNSEVFRILENRGVDIKNPNITLKISNKMDGIDDIQYLHEAINIAERKGVMKDAFVYKIIENWFDDGKTTFADLVAMKDKQSSKVPQYGTPNSQEQKDAYSHFDF